MPKQKRWVIKRLLTEASEDVVRAQNHLADVYVEFQPVHPELARYLSVMGSTLGEVKTAIERFTDEDV